jgi:hypothetical protein
MIGILFSPIYDWGKLHFSQQDQPTTTVRLDDPSSVISSVISFP